MIGWSCSSPAGRRGRRHLFLAALVALGIVLTAVALSASAASTETLTATAVHISDHPAYVEAVADFSGPRLAASQVHAGDPDPSDGTADVLVSYPDIANRVSQVFAHGLAVWVVEVPYGLNIGLGALPGAFKYLSYGIAGGHELIVDVWKSTFGPAGNVSHGPGGCLTLSRVSAAQGTISATGTAHGLFENRFRAVLRDAFGGVLASGSVFVSGAWSVTLHYTAPQGQGATFEAAASSAKDGALACLVQKAVALPASNPRANLHIVYHAFADVNGNGRRDLVTLRRTGPSNGLLTVALAGGRRLSVTTPSDATWLPGLVGSGNVDGRPGEELFVDVAHVTTAESISSYTFWHAALAKAGTLPAYGYDYGVLYGVTCSAQGTRHFITDHSFYIRFSTHQWMRQDTVYVWHGPMLGLVSRGVAKPMRGQPSPALVGVQCGHVPLAAPASDGPVAARTTASPAAGSVVPAGSTPASISFASSRTAFVLGAARCANAPCTVILSSLWGLRFADARRGYAFGAGLWTACNSTYGDGGAAWSDLGFTSDGGRTWQVTSLAGAAHGPKASRGKATGTPRRP